MPKTAKEKQRRNAYIAKHRSRHKRGGKQVKIQMQGVADPFTIPLVEYEYYKDAYRGAIITEL